MQEPIWSSRACSLGLTPSWLLVMARACVGCAMPAATARRVPTSSAVQAAWSSGSADGFGA
ncbi:hypothetical protein ADK58_02650 [Streptomyces sp. XY152]|nr:hypothetical protein ADK58_02650 [Streptomyces sp. XY152]